MSISDFIREDARGILSDWEHAASALFSAVAVHDLPALRASTEVVLLDTAEVLSQEGYRFAGGDARGMPGLAVASERCAATFLHRGISIDELIADFATLRESTLRRLQARAASGGDGLDEIDRFNGIIDGALTVAVRWYTDRLQEARDLLIGSLAHDLRNPLGAIRYAADGLRAGHDSSEDVRELTGLIRNCTLRMEKMVEEMLDHASIQLCNRLPLAPVPVDLAELCDQVMRELAVFHAGCEIRPSLTGDLSGIWDRGRIERMLSNVIGNAMEHSDGEMPVSVRAWSEAEAVFVSVHNAGSFIPPEQAHLIFEPLRRMTHHERRTGRELEGWGLGLSIARRIAEAHGGGIELASSEEGGTTFTIRLPRRTAGGYETFELPSSW